MRTTLQITNVTDNNDGTLTFEFTIGPSITLSLQEWQDEIYQCQTNYVVPVLRSLVLQEYFDTQDTSATAVYDTTAPNNAWVEKIG